MKYLAPRSNKTNILLNTGWWDKQQKDYYLPCLEGAHRLRAHMPF